MKEASVSKMRFMDKNLPKTKFNKYKCLKCIYRGESQLGYPVRYKGQWVRVYCNYSGCTNSTCLKPISHYDTIDIRGEDYENCKLFIEGLKMEKDRPTMML